jgi:sterol desaturase/sphingolipid hydroxylase (fatty acid hydroxylase superfamily)
MNYLPYIERYVNHLFFDIVRYLLFAGIPFLVFYVLFRKQFNRFKIQPRFPEWKHIKREVLYSLSSMVIFTTVGTAVFFLQRHGYTKIYTDFNAHSTGYFVFSVMAFIFIHDAYFYWSHRAMHHKKIYPHVHLIHHKSTNPTPWAVFAFHPLEALAQVAILPVMVFAMPLHPLAIFIWGIYQLFLNVGGHVGFELFPKGFTKNSLTKWHNSSTHHNLHHKYVTYNYSLYFNIWDRIMGTNHPRYTEEYEAVCERRQTQQRLKAEEPTEAANQKVTASM